MKTTNIFFSKLLFLISFVILISGEKSFSQSPTWSTSGDTISTTGNVKANSLNILGGSVAMPGIVTDTYTDLMGIDIHGKVSPVSLSLLSNILWPNPNVSYATCYGQPSPIGPFPFQYYTTFNGPGTWEIYPCVNTGFGSRNPDATVSINASATASFNAFSIGTSSIIGAGTENGTLTNVFTIDALGETTIGTPPNGNDALLCVSGFNFDNIEFSVQSPVAPGNDVFNIDVSGNTNISGNTSISGNALFHGYLGNTTSNLPLQVGTSNNTFFMGGSGSILNYVIPGFNPIESYIGFNLYSNGSGNWQNSGALGGAAILTDTHGYMNFVCIPNGLNSGVPDGDMQAAAAMVVSPHGVLVRNLGSNGTLDPQIVQNNVGSQYIFFVGGSMTAQELLILPCSGVWCDYVFDKGYKLTPLNDLEKYITENKHLPDVPSAKEVKEDGIKVGDMDVTMLKKIEELTLYIIKQQKQMDAMSEEIESLKEKSK